MTRNRNSRTSRLGHDLVALTLAAAAATVTINANAASDIFAKIGDIKGETLDDKHKDQIEVLSWSWGVTGPQRKTPACPHEFVITKFLDASSPPLIAATAQGKVIPFAMVSVRKSGVQTEDYLTFTFTDVVIAEIDSKAAVALDRVNEEISMNYKTVIIGYRKQNADGSLDPPITAAVGPSCSSAPLN
jgi:type VI secretion system secreted protein Hcp